MYGGRENLEAIDFLRELNATRTVEVSRHPDHRRGVDVLAAGDAPDLHGRARFRHQVEHGLDERYPALHRPGADLPPVPPQPAHLQHALRIHRELHAALLARRSGAWQGLDAQQDARRRMAAFRQPAHCSTPTCSPIRARSCCSWAPNSARAWSGTAPACSTGMCSNTPCTVACRRWSSDLNHLYRGSAALHGQRVRLAGFRVDRLPRFAQSILSFVRKARRRVRRRDGQLHAGAAERLPHRRAASGHLRRKSSTRIRISTAAATWATAIGNSSPRRCRG
jgi:hypothetical protein